MANAVTKWAARVGRSVGQVFRRKVVVVRDERSEVMARAIRVARSLGITTQGMVSMGMMASRGGSDMHTRFGADWTPGAVGPNEFNARHFTITMARGRDTVERNPYLKSARDRFRTNVVGRGGIRLEPDTGLPSLNEKLDRIWMLYAEHASVGRDESLMDLTGLHCDETFVGGSVIVRHVIAPAYRGIPEGPAIELIPIERLDIGLEGKMAGGNVVRQGVELDDLSRVVAYHVTKDMPNDGGWFNTRTVGTLNSNDVDRLLATNTRLSFLKTRAGQLRGGAGAAAALETLRYLDDFSLAVILSATAGASLTPIIKGMPRPEGGPVSTKFSDAAGNAIDELQPGQVGYLPFGAEVQFPTGTPMTQSLDLVSKVCLYAVGASVGVPYAALTGDYSQTNFAGSRAAELETQRGYREAQQLRYRHLVRPHYHEVVRFSMLSKRVVLTAEERAHLAKDPAALLRHRVVWPGWAWVDPKKQAEANAIELENGTTTLAAVCGEKGEWWQDTVDQRLTEELYEQEQRAKRGLAKKPEPDAEPKSLRIASTDDTDDDERQTATGGGR